jgi:hypothetical protein
MKSRAESLSPASSEVGSGRVEEGEIDAKEVHASSARPEGSN